jgi:hypothetical protein
LGQRICLHGIEAATPANPTLNPVSQRICLHGIEAATPLANPTLNPASQRICRGLLIVVSSASVRSPEAVRQIRLQ